MLTYRQIQKMGHVEYNQYREYLHKARSGLQILKQNRARMTASQKARKLCGITAATWLATGILRYEEMYKNGVRVSKN